LQEALRLGVTFFDTAQYYGLAEERLARSGVVQHPEVVVCTKCAQFLERGEYASPEILETKIRQQVGESLKALGVSRLKLLLLHGPTKEQLEDGALVGIITTLQKEGVVEYWGASTRGEESALAVINAGADVIQVAYNIADQRMVPRVLPFAKEKNVGVINRSVYLKGVFAGNAKYLSESLAPLKQCADRAQQFADSLQISLPELALRYTLSEEALSVGLVGTAKSSHLRSATEAVAKGPLPREVVETLRSFAIHDPALVDPAQWPK
jgi:aryl-alcohol dehydrogenase-like predicted oxidoreductase